MGGQIGRGAPSTEPRMFDLAQQLAEMSRSAASQLREVMHRLGIDQLPSDLAMPVSVTKEPSAVMPLLVMAHHSLIELGQQIEAVNRRV